MTAARDPNILPAEDGPAAELINPHGAGSVVLVCEHASAFIPAPLDDLGLARADRLSHAVWDPGALDVARAMADALDAPLVAARVSRLVHDCNRPPATPEAMPARVERIEVPGNRALTEAARAARARAIYDPFRALLAETLAARPEAAMVTVHSFTPVWNGERRDAQIGFLHDADDRLARAMLGAAGELPAQAALNVPYSARDGVTHTLAEHGEGRANAMIEIRNDLLSTDAAAAEMGAALARVTRAALAQEAAR